MENKRGVKRGAWTCEEDKLLKACINKYGEGKWHLVPHRAGLNRCRKSCRLRWLNYLSPDINRESFAEDEVDMMIRLHKLLGNRWTLIAGRLPGRTANDVKNYWHTHLCKKMISKKQEEKKEKEKPKETMEAHEVIKPQPLTLSSHSRWLKGKNTIMEKPIATVSIKEVTSAKDRDDEETMVTNQTGRDCVDAMWWDSLFNLGDQECGKKDGSCSLLQEENMGEQECSEQNGSCSLLPEENFVLESPKVDDFFWDWDFGSVWDI